MGTFRCYPGWIWDHRGSGISDYDLWHVLNGCGRMIIDGETYPVESGDCFLIRPDTSFFADTDPEEPITNFYCHFNFVDTDGNRVDPPRERLPELWRKIGDQSFFNGLIQRALTCRDQKDEEGAVGWVESILRELVQRERRENMDLSTRLAVMFRDFRKKIEDHPEKRRDLKKIAADSGYSQEHFSRLFKKHNGLGYRECVNQARLARAKQLLVASDCSMERIAEICGYYDIHSFSKQFKTRAGVTPTRYRRENV